ATKSPAYHSRVSCIYGPLRVIRIAIGRQLMTMTAQVTRVYEDHVKSLSVEERLELLALVARDLAEQVADPSSRPKRSIMELHGLGKEIWDGIDAQEYVNKLRDEWEHRPRCLAGMRSRAFP